jgi:hypothetical protein
MQTNLVTLFSRDVQTTDTLLYRKDLPKTGFISAIDVGMRFTNGATAPANKDPLAIINHITLLLNGTDYRFHLTGPECFRYNWVRNGHPMPYTFTEVASATQEVWFRMPFGRFMADPFFGLDLSKYNSAQLQIDYALSNFGTVGTHIITGTIAFTCILHIFPYTSRPAFRGMISVREYWTSTTVASRTTLLNLAFINPMTALYLYCHTDAIAEGVKITDVSMFKSDASFQWFVGKWYDFAQVLNDTIPEHELRYILAVTAGATKVTQVNSIKNVEASNQVTHTKV